MHDKMKFFRGNFLQSINDQDACLLVDGIVAVAVDGQSSGRVVAMGPATEIADTYELDLASLPKQAGLYLPAFYDLHFHWVQDDVREMPKASLLEWLEKYTFPTEAKYADRGYAREKAEYFWKRILSVGTIGGLCYSSIHEIALEEALRVAPEHFSIGNVLMTMHCPEALTQTIDEALASVETCAAKYGARYAASPRFAPTTAPEVLEASARVAERYGCFLQTHLAENLAEVEWVLQMYRALPGFESVESYTDIYKRVGMLGPKTVFGHCIHLSDAEWQMMADSQSLIASCPSSNAPMELHGLGSGLYDWQKADQFGVRWALCSDIGGGPFLSMFDVMESFVSQNRAAGVSNASYIQALYRSTTIGAELLGLGATKGRIAVGSDFDAILVPVDQKLLVAGEPEAILKSVVQSVKTRQEYDGLVKSTIIKGDVRFKASH